MPAKYPTRRYTRAWMTQRVLNKAPEWSRARIFPISIAQQITNPFGLELQKIYQELIDSRYNSLLSTADINQLDRVYEATLPSDLLFNTTESASGEQSYVVPTVYARFNNDETEIFIAEENDINTFWYDCLPTRIEYGEVSYSFEDIISTNTIGNLSNISPNSLVFPGHLYVTISGNTDWEAESRTKFYYSNVVLKGTLRKGTEEIQESIPIRYNSTFKTINQWEEITEVSSSYLSDDALITVSSFPFAASSFLDKRNLLVPVDGEERMRFIRLGERSWGSSLVVESYTTSNMNLIRNGNDEKEIEYELELLNEGGSNVNLNSFTQRIGTNFIFAIDNDKFYVYDINLPYPNTQYLPGESPDAAMEILFDKWIYARNETVTISTRLHSFAQIPMAIRWTVTVPNGTSYYMGADGSLWNQTIDAWIGNIRWEAGQWKDVNVDLLLDQSGTYTIGLECKYFDEETNVTKILTSKKILMTPSIKPEVEFTLPIELKNCINLAFDSDGQIWFYDKNNIYKANIFYDYFMVDYESRKIFLHEPYSYIRVVP